MKSIPHIGRTALLAGLVVAAAAALAATAQQATIDHYAELAKKDDAAFAGFSAADGKAFFLAKRTTGNADTPSCSTCHTTNPKNSGDTRAGQAIAPMAVSVTSDRFTDLAKVEKWFRRNCNTVIGRECTALEKGNFITFMAGQ